MNAILENIAHNLGAYGLGSGALLISIVTSWPVTPPKTFGDWWTWARESFQALLPVNRRQSASFPTTPEIKAVEAVPSSSTAAPTTTPFPPEMYQPKQ